MDIPTSYDLIQLILAAPDLATEAVQEKDALTALGIDWKKLLAQLLNFGIVLAVLYAFAYKPLLRVLSERREKIAKSIEDADRVEKELAEAEQTRKSIVKEANEKASSIISEAHKTAEAQVEQKIQDAVNEAEHIVTKAKEAGRLEAEKMRQAAQAEIGDLVVAAAKQVTGKVLTDDDQQRLINEAKAAATN